MQKFSPRTNSIMEKFIEEYYKEVERIKDEFKAIIPDATDEEIEDMLHLNDPIFKVSIN